MVRWMDGPGIVALPAVSGTVWVVVVLFSSGMMPLIYRLNINHTSRAATVLTTLPVMSLIPGGKL